MTVVVVHGGTGDGPRDSWQEYLTGCERAAMSAWRELQRGAAAVDAVQAAVMTLEDDPLFNAGRGSVLNINGEIEMDASIMDGATLRAGAVGAIQAQQNPVRVARRMLELGQHVLIAGSGAEQFARDQGLESCDPRELIVERQYQRWQQKFGTVGAVVMDCNGELAAATSTGGTLGKLPGRIGDSALIGCGTYADRVAAVSCTGLGEAIIRTVLAKTAADRVRCGEPPQTVARILVESLKTANGAEAGMIIIGETGLVGAATNCTFMPVCLVNETGVPRSFARGLPESYRGI